MKRNDENIKVLTKEDIIKLSNTVKRQDFLNDYKSWGVWLDIEAIDVQIYKALFPDNTCIFVTEYPAHSYDASEVKSAIYRLGNHNCKYRAYADSLFSGVDKLKSLKVQYLKEKKEEGEKKCE